MKRVATTARGGVGTDPRIFPNIVENGAFPPPLMVSMLGIRGGNTIIWPLDALCAPDRNIAH